MGELDRDLIRKIIDIDVFDCHVGVCVSDDTQHSN